MRPSTQRVSLSFSGSPEELYQRADTYAAPSEAQLGWLRRSSAKADATSDASRSRKKRSSARWPDSMPQRKSGTPGSSRHWLDRLGTRGCNGRPSRAMWLAPAFTMTTDLGAISLEAFRNLFCTLCAHPPRALCRVTQEEHVGAPKEQTPPMAYHDGRLLQRPTSAKNTS